MNPQQPSDLTSNRGTASGRHQPLYRPGDERGSDNRLHDLDLEARGESLEDHQRDRASKGVAGGYDDAVATRKGKDEGNDYLGIARGD